MTNIDRRKFVKSTIGLGLTGIALNGRMGAFAAPKNVDNMGKINNIGVQLYTVRDLMKENLEKTISQVAGIGYKQVEFAGYFGRDAKQIRNILEQNGLKSPSTHVQLSQLKGDALKTLIEDSKIMGHKYITMAGFGDADRETLDQFKAHTELFNKVGEECKKANVQFAYHNHEFEFKAIDGVEPYDLFLNEVDADLLKMEMDLFWITSAGRDPLHYFERYPGRFPMCHVKDMKKDGSMVAVGMGSMDFEKIFSHAEQAGLEHYFVEHDEPIDSLESIKYSFNTLEKMKIS